MTYLATADCADAEMEKRIELHRARRPASWATWEGDPRGLPAAVARTDGLMLMDCLTMWLTRLFLASPASEEGGEAEWLAEEAKITALARVLFESVKPAASLVVVSNEVGLGLVPPYRMGRRLRDMQGRKMSKHLGNVVSPFDELNKFGADALRWYFYTTSAPWLPSRYSEKAVREGQNKFLATLQNVYAFFAMYADIDNFDPTAHDLKNEQLSLMDKWILSKLNTLIKRVDDDLWNYRVTEPALAIQDFVDELSNWYVRRGRERFWGKGDVKDKDAAFTTLYHVLVTLSKVCAPFIPFLSEEIYQNLVVNNVPGAPESVHLCDFPTADESAIDADMEAQMDALVEVVQLGRACRNLANIKTRQTAAKLYVKGASFSESYQALCEDELNVKEVVFTESAREFTTYQLKPQMRTLGPKYGKLLGKIGQHLQTMDGNDVVDAFERGETVSFDIDGTLVTLSKDDVLTSPMQKSGFVAQEDKGVTVVLDTNLTPELIAEGYVRELVSKVQTMRKESDFDVTDRVDVRHERGDVLASAIESGVDMLKRGTLAEVVERAPMDDTFIVRDWSINGQDCKLGVRVHK